MDPVMSDPVLYAVNNLVYLTITTTFTIHLFLIAALYQ